MTSTAFGALALLSTTVIARAQDGPQPPAGGGPPPGAEAAANVPRGLKVNEKEALQGYTLIAPLRDKKIALVDMAGEVVHEWATDLSPGSEYFLANGNLLRCARDESAPRFRAGGQCGRLQEIAWDGTVVWDWAWMTDEHLQHHDIAPTPDGTILFIAWEWKTRAEAIAAGRHPGFVGDEGIWADCVIEIEPIHPDGAEIIWEWHVWDHLIQDLDADADNYGSVAEHPELLDVNADLRRQPATEEEMKNMQALGYIADRPTAGQRNADWLHTNAIDYDPQLDQIALSSPHLSEIWIIDHSTTSDEATGHEGGITGKGGDILWRWGNPANYGAGLTSDRQLFGQHDVRWIPEGFPGAGHLTVFNNGGGRPDGDYSSVLELELPLRDDNTYGLEPFVAVGPAKPAWSYVAENRADFFSSFISGAHRLQNGNTLICAGAPGRVFEVTKDGRIVWDYLNPLGEAAPGVATPVPPHALFRATRIPADHPGLKGRTLKPIQKTE